MSKHKHLARLDRVWVEQPIFFITTCTANRRPVLANGRMHEVCRRVWRRAEELYGWSAGRYVLMPDHVHFFCAPTRDECDLQTFIGKWKEWTGKTAGHALGVLMPLWQEEFFDHVLRSGESYEQKWEYVRQNPVRAGLIDNGENWPYQGELNQLRYE